MWLVVPASLVVVTRRTAVFSDNTLADARQQRPNDRRKTLHGGDG